MRPLRTLLAISLTGIALAALEAPVYTFGPAAHPSTGNELPSISPSNARLYLAQRLGLSQFHGLGDADEITLQLLNEDASRRAPMFSDREEQIYRRSLLIIEGVEDSKEIVPSNMGPSFYITNPPARQSNRQLVEKFTEQGEISSFDQRAKQVVTLQDTAQTFGAASTENRNEVAAIRNMLIELASAADQETTVILMPPAPEKSKRSASDWGGFGKPAANLRARKAQKETPLSEGSSTASKLPKTSKVSMSSLAKNGSIPKTTIPTCYSSENNCVGATANCTGHGSCIKKFTERVSEDEEGPECWSCACSATEIPVQGGGKKVVYWGGPACQKKDVSMPFFLLAGFTIAIVSAIAWGIGLLYSIGQEDLPSVLGAGVAGPTARK